MTEAVFARVFTKGHKAPLDIDADSKVPSNATQVEMKNYLKRIVPKEYRRLMTLLTRPLLKGRNTVV